MTTKDMHLSTELRRLRDEKGLSQHGLAAKSGIHRVTIADIERRDHTNPTLATVCKLASALDVSPAALLSR
jgi:transcriptional regulator with XRE-family HTH domain